MPDLDAFPLDVPCLGPRLVSSPLASTFERIGGLDAFTGDAERILQDIRADAPPGGASYERAGPRREIYFDPREVKAAVVTCGGLCPGLNAVIRGIVLELRYLYGVEEVWGIRYGYGGLLDDADPPPIRLTPEYVSEIHLEGGTKLGTSRGNPGPDRLAESIRRAGYNILFCVGGDGTLRGACALAEEARRMGLRLAVVGVPKTIDNDIPHVYRSFGFETAVDEARKVLECAHVEANGVANGVGLVKLMGREAGFIAARATLACGDVNYCLVPEMEVDLHGPGGLLQHLRARLRRRRHAVIALSEGAFRSSIGDSGRRDASGNVIFNDAGLFLKDEIEKAFKGWGEPVSVKYFDPSYSIRSVPPAGDDSIFCATLAKYAVDAAMAGKTAMFIGFWHGEFTHVPLAAAAIVKKRLSRRQRLWRDVLSSTGQPAAWW